MITNHIIQFQTHIYTSLLQNKYYYIKCYNSDTTANRTLQPHCVRVVTTLDTTLYKIELFLNIIIVFIAILNIHTLQKMFTPSYGYVGFLSSWTIYVNLIYNLAKNNPCKSVLLIWNKDKEFNTKIYSVLRNVYFLGIKTIQEIPLYINSFDICINPQLLNESTAGNYPRKIDEYLYAGKPVVATKTKMMESFKDFVCLCEGIEEYQKAIDSILLKKETINDIKRRKEFASSHNWENCINRIYKLIKENLSDA